jgi:hypothetical protein
VSPGDGVPLNGLAAHRALELDWDDPPPELERWLDAAAEVEFQETEAQELYLEEVDLPAHPDDPGRRERYLRALAQVRSLADAGAPLGWSELSAIQGRVLGLEGPAPLRTGDAFARGGREVYPWSPELGAEFTARVSYALGAPILEGVRRYLDLIFFHPFDDGNARAARLSLEFALRSGGVPSPPLAPFVGLPKPAGSSARAWDLARLLSRSALRQAGVCPGSLGLE